MEFGMRNAECGKEGDGGTVVGAGVEGGRRKWDPPSSQTHGTMARQAC